MMVLFIFSPFNGYERDRRGEGFSPRPRPRESWGIIYFQE
jgi:hypothetical protein